MELHQYVGLVLFGVSAFITGLSTGIILGRGPALRSAALVGSFFINGRIYLVQPLWPEEVQREIEREKIKARQDEFFDRRNQEYFRRKRAWQERI